jgi:hypothetical protein
MSKKSMSRAFGVSKEHQVELGGIDPFSPLPMGVYTLTVLKAEYIEAKTTSSGVQIPEKLHLFCKVEGDTRVVNVDFQCWPNTREESFKKKLNALFQRLGTDNVEEMVGKTFSARLKANIEKDGQFFRNYWCIYIQ